MNPYLTCPYVALFAHVIIISDTHPSSVRIKTVVGAQLKVVKKSVGPDAHAPSISLSLSTGTMYQLVYKLNNMLSLSQ